MCVRKNKAPLISISEFFFRFFFDWHLFWILDIHSASNCPYSYRISTLCVHMKCIYCIAQHFFHWYALQIARTLQSLHAHAYTYEFHKWIGIIFLFASRSPFPSFASFHSGICLHSIKYAAPLHFVWAVPVCIQHMIRMWNTACTHTRCCFQACICSGLSALVLFLFLFSFFLLLPCRCLCCCCLNALCCSI